MRRQRGPATPPWSLRSPKLPFIAFASSLSLSRSRFVSHREEKRCVCVRVSWRGSQPPTRAHGNAAAAAAARERKRVEGKRQGTVAGCLTPLSLSLSLVLNTVSWLECTVLYCTALLLAACSMRPRGGVNCPRRMHAAREHMLACSRIQLFHASLPTP